MPHGSEAFGKEGGKGHKGPLTGYQKMMRDQALDRNMPKKKKPPMKDPHPDRGQASPYTALNTLKRAASEKAYGAKPRKRRKP